MLMIYFLSFKEVIKTSGGYQQCNERLKHLNELKNTYNYIVIIAFKILPQKEVINRK